MVSFTKINYSIIDDHDRLAILTHTTQTLSSTSLIDDEYLTNLHTSFSTIGDTLNHAMYKSSASPLTDDIGEYHEQRISHIKGIQSGIVYFLTHEDDQKVSSAQIVQESYDRYLKNLPDKRRDTVSQAVDNFLDAIKSEKAIAALEILDMGEKIELLREAQMMFITTSTKRAENEELDTTPRISKIRMEMHRIFDVLDTHLYYQQYLNNEEYGELTHKLNSRIQEIMAIARSKHTMEMHEEEENQEIEYQV